MTQEHLQQDSPAAPASPDNDDIRWERDLLKNLATASLVEQRRARRWSYVFKFALLVYLVVVLVLYLPRGIS